MLSQWKAEKEERRFIRQVGLQCTVVGCHRRITPILLVTIKLVHASLKTAVDIVSVYALIIIVTEHFPN